MLIVLVLVGIVLLIALIAYNSLIGKKNQVENAFASVDALLKKRYDLIPNLVSSVQQYMKHETGTLTEITRLRAQAVGGTLSADETVELNNQLGRTMRGLMVAVESYPQLRATENFQNLERSLNEVEEQISAGRRAFNAAVTDYNNAVEMVPTNVFARMMSYKPRKLFEIAEAERQAPSVKALFKG
jgi:LemA protein